MVLPESASASAGSSTVSRISRVVRAESFGTVFQERPPRLAVEVASPRTWLYDRNRKKDIYQQFGIPAY